MNVGLSTCSKELNEELFSNYFKAGISHMELSCYAEQYNSIDCNNLETWAKKYEICLWSCHLPFSSPEFMNISSLNKKICQETIRYHSELIKKFSSIGIKKFVLHPSSEPIFDENRSLHMNMAKESIAILAEQAKACDAVIAVENLPRSCLGCCSDEILELINVHQDVKVCFDTNHLLKEKIEDFIKKVGNKIVTTHISDYDFINERHWLPGEGKINWSDFYSLLQGINYRGVWMYEIDFSCPKTIIRDRSLCCADFTKNAEEIFNKKPITVFSRPKPNLGIWE